MVTVEYILSVYITRYIILTAIVMWHFTACY